MGIRLLSLTTASIALSVGLSASTAYAGLDDPILEMQVLRNLVDPAWGDLVQGEQVEEGSWVYGGTYDADPEWDIEYNVRYDFPTGGVGSSGNPINVFLTFGLTNNTGGAETFTVIANLPLLASLINTSVTGDVEGTLSDSNFDGSSLLTDAGGPIYQGKVDGVSELDLLTAPFSFSAPAFGSAGFGPFLGAEVGPALASSDAEIEITFTLSDGDSASFTANFQIDGMQIPAPAALALFGVIGLVPRRRRA